MKNWTDLLDLHEKKLVADLIWMNTVACIFVRIAVLHIDTLKLDAVLPAIASSTGIVAFSQRLQSLLIEAIIANVIGTVQLSEAIFCRLFSVALAANSAQRVETSSP